MMVWCYNIAKEGHQRDWLVLANLMITAIKQQTNWIRQTLRNWWLERKYLRIIEIRWWLGKHRYCSRSAELQLWSIIRKTFLESTSRTTDFYLHLYLVHSNNNNIFVRVWWIMCVFEQLLKEAPSCSNIHRDTLFVNILVINIHWKQQVNKVVNHSVIMDTSLLVVLHSGVTSFPWP